MNFYTYLYDISLTIRHVPYIQPLNFSPSGPHTDEKVRRIFGFHQRTEKKETGTGCSQNPLKEHNNSATLILFKNI